jgi:endonuclease/exonuclease/phosphatase family metal-dependent hydrolase
MKIMTWLLVVPGLVWAVLRLGGWDRGILVQLLSFTTYVAAFAWLPLIFALTRRQWPAALVALIAAVALTVMVLPRALPGRSPATGVRLQVMTSNMLLGGADPKAIVDLVRAHDIDVLAVQEFSPEAEAGLKAAGLDQLLPYSSLGAEAGASGSGLYSRFPITDPGVSRNGGGFNQAYGTITPPGAEPLLVESAHPAAPYSVKALKDWRADLLAEPHATGPKGMGHGTARILLGDFNSTLDHAELRNLISHDYRDAAATVGKGLVPTWGIYHGPRRLPPITIDHVLVDQRIGVREVQVHRIPQSDHRAVLAWLTVPPVAATPEAK